MASSNAGPPNPTPNVSQFQGSQPIIDEDFNPYHSGRIEADVNWTTDKAGYVSTHYLSPVSSV